MSIQCLKCKNDALEGKALCKRCFDRHEIQLQAEESEDWISEQLKTTRGGFRKRTREARANATRKKAIQLVVAGVCLLALAGAFAAIMIFIPADSSPPDLHVRGFPSFTPTETPTQTPTQTPTSTPSVSPPPLP